MNVLGVILILLVTPSYAALASYIGGRILLPEIGLAAPQYTTWFWFYLFIIIFATPVYMIKAVVNER